MNENHGPTSDRRSRPGRGPRLKYPAPDPRSTPRAALPGRRRGSGRRPSPPRRRRRARRAGSLSSCSGCTAGNSWETEAPRPAARRPSRPGAAEPPPGVSSASARPAAAAAMLAAILRPDRAARAGLPQAPLGAAQRDAGADRREDARRVGGLHGLGRKRPREREGRVLLDGRAAAVVARREVLAQDPPLRRRKRVGEVVVEARAQDRADRAHAFTTPRTNSGPIRNTRSCLHHSADEFGIETADLPAQDPPGVEEVVADGRLAAAEDLGDLARVESSISRRTKAAFCFSESRPETLSKSRASSASSAAASRPRPSAPRARARGGGSRRARARGCASCAGSRSRGSSRCGRARCSASSARRSGGSRSRRAGRPSGRRPGRPRRCRRSAGRGRRPPGSCGSPGSRRRPCRRPGPGSPAHGRTARSSSGVPGFRCRRAPSAERSPPAAVYGRRRPSVEAGGAVLSH